MYKMAVVGDKDSVMGFKALGLTVEYAYDAEKAGFAIHRLAREGTAVIFVTEALAEQIPETLERYKSSMLPAIIPIPGNEGSRGFAMANLSQNVEKAVGVNIFVNEEGE